MAKKRKSSKSKKGASTLKKINKEASKMYKKAGNRKSYATCQREVAKKYKKKK